MPRNGLTRRYRRFRKRNAWPEWTHPGHSATRCFQTRHSAIQCLQGAASIPPPHWTCPALRRPSTAMRMSPTSRESSAGLTVMEAADSSGTRPIGGRNASQSHRTSTQIQAGRPRGTMSGFSSRTDSAPAARNGASTCRSSSSRGLDSMSSTREWHCPPCWNGMRPPYHTRR